MTHYLVVDLPWGYGIHSNAISSKLMSQTPSKWPNKAFRACVSWQTVPMGNMLGCLRADHDNTPFFMLFCFILLVTCCTAKNVPASYANFSPYRFPQNSGWCLAYVNQLLFSKIIPGIVEERFIYTNPRCNDTGWMKTYISCFPGQCNDNTYMPSTRRNLWEIWSKVWFNSSSFVRSQWYCSILFLKFINTYG